jgi:transaldolase
MLMNIPWGKNGHCQRSYHQSFSGIESWMPELSGAGTKNMFYNSGDVSVEVIEEDASGMIAQARQIAKWASNVVVKIPATEPGLESTSVLTREGIRVNMTLCFSLNQAILAALAGASYVSPFVGRLDDIGEDGMALIADIVDVFDRHSYNTKVLAASIRHPAHVLQAAKFGAHVITMPYKVLTQMIKHPLTDIGIERFLL